MEANASDADFGAAAVQRPECRTKESGYLCPSVMPSGGNAEKNVIQKEVGGERECQCCNHTTADETSESRELYSDYFFSTGKNGNACIGP